MTTSDPDRLIRPYLITRGRTRPVDELPLEALVETTPAAHQRTSMLLFESRRVIDLCQTPLSIAEIAAVIEIPIGVVRVLVADLAAERLLTIHRTVSIDGPDIPLLERLLEELRSS